jgi:ATP-dependent helicase HrpA
MLRFAMNADFIGMLNVAVLRRAATPEINRKLAQEVHAILVAVTHARVARMHGQLHAIVAEMGMQFNQRESSYEALHRALTAGLLGNIGMKNEQGEYDGARGIRFAVHPASGLRKRAAPWLIAAELMETTRLFARSVAQVEPQWIEAAASHLVKRVWFEPRWDRERAQPIAWEQVSLYGLVLVARRRVAYGPIDPSRS